MRILLLNSFVEIEFESVQRLRRFFREILTSEELDSKVIRTLFDTFQKLCGVRTETTSATIIVSFFISVYVKRAFCTTMIRQSSFDIIRSIRIKIILAVLMIVILSFDMKKAFITQTASRNEFRLIILIGHGLLPLFYILQ
nr:MAG TPA: hypothetical protein [Caudoviricetes sp.]